MSSHGRECLETTFTWAESYRGKKVDPQAVGETITEIEQRDGVCHPAALVDAARPETSPLHELCEWDDAVAGEQFRIAQMRSVIRSVRVVKDDRPESAPTFVHVRKVDTQGVHNGYVQTVRAMDDSELRQQVLADALAQLRGLRKRFASLEELQPVWQLVDTIKETA